MPEKPTESTTDRTIPHPEHQPFMSVTEVAAVLGLSRAHTYRLAGAGDIPSVRRGRRVLFPTVAIRRFAHLPDLPAERVSS